jgi:hypothetical protein
MKKLMMLILTLLLCASAFAEGAAAIPVKIADPANGHIALETAITTALQVLPVQPESYQTHAELVRMSDDGARWIVTVFDLTTLSDGWCVEIDAFTGEVLMSYTTYDGFFQDVYDRWVAQKGIHALWPLEDKQLYDMLYSMMPAYGLPQVDDMSKEAVLTKALFVLGLQSADEYQVGYGYLMGGEGYNGVWEITLVKNGQVAYRVNLDAVTGEVYYMEPDESGNG